MSFVRIAALVLGTLFGLFILGGLVLPGEIRVARSIETEADLFRALRKLLDEKRG